MSASPSNGGEPPRARASLFRRAQKPKPTDGDLSSQSRKPKKPQRSLLSLVSAFLTFVLVGALLAFAAVAWLMMEARRPGPLLVDRVVNIVREDDGGSIADQLERAGVIDSSTWFSLLTLLDGNRSAMKRGEYEFKAGVSMNDIESLLASHKVVRHKVTLPEGLTSDQIVSRLRDDDVLLGEIKETPREGSLMPDTYFFERGDTRQSIIAPDGEGADPDRRRNLERARARSADRSPGEMVTLASIVEKETGKAEERPRVASVFVNRLAKHMRLESDPTIVYGLVFGKGTLGRPISRADLNQATPYNTYIIDGLPPGPISNPGKAALEAVANPARTRDLYFVADGTGGHVFANTFDQHLKNVVALAADREGRQGPSRARREPDGAAAIHGALEPADPAAFGALVAGPRRRPGETDARAIVARLARIGAEAASDGECDVVVRRRVGGRQDDRGDRRGGRPASTTGPRGRGIRRAAASGAGSGSAASVPMSPAMLADERAREAKYGIGAPVGGVPRPPQSDRVRFGRAGRLGAAARLRCVGGHKARSAAQQDLRSQLRQGRAGRAAIERSR